MSVEETNHEQTPADADAQTGTPTGEHNGDDARAFTQADVDKIVANRLRKAERAIERRVRNEMATLTEESEASTPPNTAKPDPTEQALEAVREMRAELDFRDRTTGKILTPEQRATVRKVQDPDAQTQMIDLYHQQNQVKQKQAESAPEADAPIYRSPGVGSAPPAGDLETDATQWSNDQIQQWREDGTFLTRVEQYRNRLAGGANRIFSKRPIKPPK